jgi:hypothetical protein
MVAKVMETPTVSKRATQEFDVERFNLKKLHEEYGKEQYHKISNRFAALENVDDDVDIKIA